MMTDLLEVSHRLGMDDWILATRDTLNEMRYLKSSIRNNRTVKQSIILKPERAVDKLASCHSTANQCFWSTECLRQLRKYFVSYFVLVRNIPAFLFGLLRLLSAATGIVWRRNTNGRTGIPADKHVGNPIHLSCQDFNRWKSNKCRHLLFPEHQLLFW